MSNSPEGADFESDAPWRQEDYSDSSEAWKECEYCLGEGIYDTTDCCGTKFYEPGYPDIDICMGCGEHSHPPKCEDCDGKGEVLISYEEFINRIVL